MSKKGSVAYTENDSVKECWKNSLFPKLFSDRKKLFESYPKVSKGLVLSDPTINFGNGTYTFKTSETVDKATFKKDGREFQARYKKDVKQYDVSVKEKVADGYTAMVKYENRPDNEPHYVVGLDFNCSCGVIGNAKFNPFTGIFKLSGIYNCDKFVNGVKIGADLKTALPVKEPQFNVGAVYSSPAGVTGVAYNHKGLVTINHFLQVDKKLSTGLEFVQATRDDAVAANPLALAVGYKIDAEHELRGRFNKKGELNLCLKKDFSKQFSLQVATVLDATKTDSLFKAPQFGFKLKADM